MDATSTLEQFRTALTVLAALPTDVRLLNGWSDTELLEATRLHAEGNRLYGAVGATLAGQLAFRSRPKLGSQGLARRSGHRTVDNLLKLTTGATRHEVQTVVAAGTLLVDAANDGRIDEATGEVFTSTQPWMRPVAVAVGSGAVSASAAKSIGRGLGTPNSAVSSTQLQGAATTLVGQAVAGVDADQLFLNARSLRDDLDFAGVGLREHEYRQLRGLTHHRTDTGGRAVMDMDPENYARFVTLYDRMVSPKLGGVRFVDPTRAQQADTIRDDERTPKQLALDGFLQLLIAGANADDSMMLGSGAPVIRITVADTALDTGVGLARIDGQPIPVSLDTVCRLLCTGIQRTITIDAFGNITEPDDHDTDHRLFTKRQGDYLAAKFGGCMDPACDRPPSWCENHHILHWKRDQGPTRLDNGILLCRYHHLEYHHHGTEIIRDDHGQYWKIPSPSDDPTQTPVHMPLKTKNLHDLYTATTRLATLAQLA